eukprot:1308752-Prymnesium_polylepis.2
MRRVASRAHRSHKTVVRKVLAVRRRLAHDLFAVHVNKPGRVQPARHIVAQQARFTLVKVESEAATRLQETRGRRIERARELAILLPAAAQREC